MRALRVLSVIGVILIGSLVAAALLVPSRLDPVLVRAALEHAAADRLGAAVIIEGPVAFTLLPRPVLTAGRVSLLHGAPGDADGLAVTADSLSARLDLRALLRGRFAAAELVLRGAEVLAPFPFDVRLLTAGRPDSLRSSAIVLRDSRVRFGPLVVSEVEARLAADALTGDMVFSGTFRLAGGSAWRGVLHLSRPGGDGSAALTATLDEIYAADGMTAALTGQLSGAGSLSGQLTASGPSLARLTAAPAVPFRVSGRAGIAGGLVTLEEAQFTLDGVPGRLDATLRLPPRLHLDLNVVASRLDLDAWRAALGAAPRLALPMEIGVTAEAASLAGGAVRQLRADAAIDGASLSLRDVEAILPGEMRLRASGLADLASATSRLDLRLDGADARVTAGWLGGLAGVPAIPPPPPPLFRALALQATVETAGSEIEAHDLDAMLDGARLRGDALAAGPKPGSPASLAAILTVDRLDLSPWLAWWRDGGAGQPWPKVDVTLQLTVDHAALAGLSMAPLRTDVAWRGGALDLRRLEATAPTWTARASGARGADGKWSDAVFTIAADRIGVFAPVLPVSWRDWLDRWPGVAAQPLHATVDGSGSLETASATLVGNLGALHVEARPAFQADADRLSGQLTLLHPSARRLAGALGIQGLDFLGEGSLSASADLSMEGGAIEATAIRLRAGELATEGDLRLDASGAVSGAIRASVLNLPPFDPRSASPLPTGLLSGWSGSVDLDAARVQGLGVDLAPLKARVGLEGGRLAVADITCGVAGGTVSGRLDFDTVAQPPVAVAEVAAAGLRLGAQSWHPVGLMARAVSGTARLRGQGYAPATMLATLSGQLRLDLDGASLTGMDVGGLGGDLSDEAVRAALSTGRTVLDSAHLALDIEQGLARLQASALASGGATVQGTGGIDLPAATMDLDLRIRPAITDAPFIGLHLTGPVSGASATPALGELAKWRAAHS